jgi:uncharacterized protein (DUF302 family)
MKRPQLTSILLLFFAVSFLSVQAQEKVEKHTYYYIKTIKGSYESIVTDLKATLKEKKYAVVSEIPLSKTVNTKLNKNMPTYTLFGICNAGHAYQLVSQETNMGLLLPCKLIIRQTKENTFEAALIDPVTLFEITENPILKSTAETIRKDLLEVLEKL